MERAPGKPGAFCYPGPMEKTVIICDYCEESAVTTATVRLNGSKQALHLDLCVAHRDEMKDAAHPAKRGRRVGTYAE